MPLRMPVAMIAALFAAAPAFAEITIVDPYARVASPAAKSGAVFLELHNDADSADRLIAASSPAAKRVELHTHVEQSNGVMRMTEIEDGILVPANGAHVLKRGGDHVMFMGLVERWSDGDIIPLTLIFETAGEVQLEVPVDLNRKPAMDHGAMN